jgi:Ca-activated chloride channel family protein
MRKFLTSYPKWVIFSLAGMLGAMIFNSFYELIGDNHENRNFITLALFTGFWYSWFSVGVVLALSLIQRTILGAEEYFKDSIKPILIGLSIGFLSGAFAQILFALMEGGEFIRVIAWSLAGGGLGFAISLAIPNLKASRAFLFGLLGGLVGGICFIIAFEVFSHLRGVDMNKIANIAARLTGLGAIGFFVGLSVAIAESTTKQGYLRVIWGPGEFTRVNLGETPVIVGSSRESTIRTASSSGYPSVVATFSLEKGQAKLINHMAGSTHILKDGNKLNLGTIVIEVHLS